MSVTYTVDTHLGPVSKTAINGFPCPWRQDVVETIIPLLSNLNSNSVFVDCGSLEPSMAYMASIFGNGCSVYAHHHWIATGWEDQGYPPDEGIATYWDFWNSIKKLGLQKGVVPMRGMVQYTLGCHDAQTVDLAFISFNHLGIDYIDLDIKVLMSRMKPGGTIIAVENYPSNPKFDQILQTIPNSKQITTLNTVPQTHRVLRFMSITC